LGPFLVCRPRLHRHLTSFPTRRSSDLRSAFKFQIHVEPSLNTKVSRARPRPCRRASQCRRRPNSSGDPCQWTIRLSVRTPRPLRSEEHTSELQSLTNLVCRLLLEKKQL